jgi:general secretion pathway protein A
MYYDFFGVREPPFSIAPDPRYLYLSERHKEALAHLMYGIQGQGGFIVITGEVGTGKTTVSRCFIGNVPEHVDIALILNPKLSARELLSSICDEFGIRHPVGLSIKRLIDLLNADLLAAYAAGRHKVLMIDEAQNLSPEVLEQLRLLTNLETSEKKLLQIVLLGQPELQEILSRPSLRQLSQRITARYHLDAIHRHELPAYLRYRLSVAGQGAELFSPRAIRKLYRFSGGVPRLINLLSDRALLGAYSADERRVGAAQIKQAAKEVMGRNRAAGPTNRSRLMRYGSLAASVAAAVALTLVFLGQDETRATGVFEIPITSGNIERADTDPDVASPDSVEKKPVTSADGSANSGPLPEPAKEQELASRAMSLANAFGALFRAWGVTYDQSEAPIACEFAEARGLRCMHRSGSWRSLERLDHPVILDLQELPGDNRFITLLALEGDLATVATSVGKEQVPVDRIRQDWFGDYSLLWRVPPFLSDTPETGPEDSKALWLTARLMRLIELHATDGPERKTVEAMNLTEQIRWYQSEKGLEPDGIAGPMTLMQMASDLDSGSPRLTTQEDRG